jgi:hypothetical protein
MPLLDLPDELIDRIVDAYHLAAENEDSSRLDLALRKEKQPDRVFCVNAHMEQLALVNKRFRQITYPTMFSIVGIHALAAPDNYFGSLFEKLERILISRPRIAACVRSVTLNLQMLYG